MKNKKAFLISSSIILALFILDRAGLFKNPLLGTLVIILILLGFPIAWQIKEYIKKKSPEGVFLTKCSFCGFDIPEDATHCHSCGRALENEFEGHDEFVDKIKDKEICPHCGLKELETIYEISKGYKEVCTNCGKSRISRKAIKYSFYLIAYFVAAALIFYWFIQINMK
jgi:hypothetical protein